MTLVLVAAPIVAGLAAVPQFSAPIQSFINGELNNFLEPRLPWLSLRADFVSANKVLELRLDVGHILKKIGIKF